MQIVDITNVAKWAKDGLSQAHKDFAKSPNGLAWTLCLEAMMTHQQIQFAKRSPTVDVDGLMQKLASTPMGYWRQTICRAITGTDLKDAIKY